MKHKKMMIFEGTMCCSSGVCGPEPDKALVEFSDTVKKLQQDYLEMQIQRVLFTML